MNPMEVFEDADFLVQMKRVDWKSIRAVADVTFRLKSGEQFTAFGFRVVHLKGQEPWVAVPQTSYTKDGEIKNKKILELPRTLQRKLFEVILNGYNGLK